MFGVTQFWHYDPDKDVAHIESRQDHDVLVEATKARFNSFDQRARWKGDVHHVASIPNVIVNDLMAKGILRDRAAMKRWLNDPDNRVFRTRPGKV